TSSPRPPMPPTSSTGGWSSCTPRSTTGPRPSTPARTSTTKRCGSCGTSAGGRDDFSPTLRPVGATEAARVRRIDRLELPVDPEPSGHVEYPRRVAEADRSHRVLEFVYEVDLECLPGDIGADDLDIAVPSDLLRRLDRLGDGAVHRGHRGISRQLLGTMSEDQFRPRPRTTVGLGGHLVAFIGLRPGRVVAAAAGDDDGDLRSHALGGALGIRFGGREP